MQDGSKRCTGLTPFICAMMVCPRDKLERADVAKLAERWGIGEDWCRFYLNAWLGR